MLVQMAPGEPLQRRPTFQADDPVVGQAGLPREPSGHRCTTGSETGAVAGLVGLERPRGGHGSPARAVTQRMVIADQSAPRLRLIRWPWQASRTYGRHLVHTASPPSGTGIQSAPMLPRGVAPEASSALG